MRRFSRTWALISALITLVGGTALGSGFGLFEQGAKATAMAGAFAATADDPSAIFYNVAGIAQQRRAAVYLGGTTINFSNEFTGDPNDPFASGSRGFYKRHTFIPPNAYAIVPIGSNLTFGVGVMTPFGLRTNWAAPWIGRFASRDANIKVLSVEPAIAWQSSSGNVAVGGGVEYRRAKVTLARNSGAINPFLGGHISDVASTFLTSDWKSKTGWNAGILFKPGTWRLGASYRSSMTMNFKGNVTVTQILTGTPLDAVVPTLLPHNQGVTTSIPFPAIAAVGIASTAIPTWDIEFDVTHTTWSRFKELPVNFNDQPAFSFVRPQNWKNTNSYRIGANKMVNAQWDVRLGALLDKNPQPVEAVSPLLPDADRLGATFGLGFHKGPWVIDASEFVLHFKRRSTEGRSTDLNGTYKTDANLISLNLGYRF